MVRKTHSIGTRFGRLAVICAEPKSIRRNSGKTRLEWLCRCDCGVEKYFRSAELLKGRAKSCGCLRIDLMRAKKGTSSKYDAPINFTPGRLRAYRSWEKLNDRCYNKDNDHYKYYGARGITVCAEWRKSFDQFFRDMGERPYGLSIGRIDNDKGYEPGNCRWENAEQQSNNKTTTIYVVQDEKIGPEPLALMCSRLEVSSSLVASRLKLGWSLDKALADLITFEDDD